MARRIVKKPRRRPPSWGCEFGGDGGGEEAPNALVPAAVVGAFFDATGMAPRRIPLTPGYVIPLLKG